MTCMSPGLGRSLAQSCASIGIGKGAVRMPPTPRVKRKRSVLSLAAPLLALSSSPWWPHEQPLGPPGRSLVWLPAPQTSSLAPIAASSISESWDDLFISVSSTSMFSVSGGTRAPRGHSRNL